MKLINNLHLIDLIANFKPDKGFWITMGISFVVALLMIIIFWALPPKAKK